MRIKKAVALFLKELGKTRAKKTVASYANSLDLFTWYLDDWAGIKSLERVDKDNIEEFLSWWYIRKYLPSSASGAKELLKALRKFFKWIASNNLLDLVDEVEGVYQALKVDLPNSFKITEMLYKEAKLLSFLESEPKSPHERMIASAVYECTLKDLDERIGRQIRSFLAKGKGKYVEGGYFEVIEVGTKHVQLKSLETGKKIGKVLISNEDCLKLLRKGFILCADFYVVGEERKMVELGPTYPPMARRFV